MEFYYDSVDEDVLILSADGGLIADSAAHFVGELERYIELGVRKLLVDCSRLTIISSHGLGVLVRMNKRMAKKGGEVKFAAVGGAVGRVIRLTGLGPHFAIYATVEDARRAFGLGAAKGDASRRSDSTHPHVDGHDTND